MEKTQLLYEERQKGVVNHLADIVIVSTKTRYGFNGSKGHHRRKGIVNNK